MHMRSLVFSLFAIVIAFSAAPASADALKQQQIVDNATVTLREFTADPDLTWFRDNVKDAKGLMIFPRSVKGGLIWGGSGGNGILVGRRNNGWSYPAFYTTGSVTFGLQAGVEVSEIVLMVMTERGLDALFTADVKLGGDISVAAGPVGVGAKAQTADILAFVRSKGLYGGINLEGTVVKPRRNWNKRYYGKDVRPSEIIRGNSVKRSGVGKLFQALNDVNRL